jgi:hypothetical protein
LSTASYTDWINVSITGSVSVLPTCKTRRRHLPRLM